MNNLTHFDDEGKAIMADVSDKAVNRWVVVARSEIRLQLGTLSRILDRKIEKGNVFDVARLAGIMAAKKTPEILPPCHPLLFPSIKLTFISDSEESCILIEASVKLTGQTGVEMEALTTVSTEALINYDMSLEIDRNMTIGAIHLAEKSGSCNGHFQHMEERL